MDTDSGYHNHFLCIVLDILKRVYPLNKLITNLAINKSREKLDQDILLETYQIRCKEFSRI